MVFGGARFVTFFTAGFTSVSSSPLLLSFWSFSWSVLDFSSSESKTFAASNSKFYIVNLPLSFLNHFYILRLFVVRILLNGNPVAASGLHGEQIYPSQIKVCEYFEKMTILNSSFF